MWGWHSGLHNLAQIVIWIYCNFKSVLNEMKDGLCGGCERTLWSGASKNCLKQAGFLYSWYLGTQIVTMQVIFSN